MQTRTLFTAASAMAIAAGMALAGPASAQEQEAATEAEAASNQVTASADLMTSEGEAAGTVAIVETPHGLLVQLDAEGLPAGGHGFHIHETGQCDAPDFQSAGGHFAPEGNQHGVLSEGGPHAGDLPNIYVPESGALRADFFVPNVTIADGDDALLDDDGAAFMIHSSIDDYETDPAGDAGERIACGVVAAVAEPAAQ
ncbi:superoxide dismutase family protein [Lutibaculum baratangense]|uniref:Superoxide dismutase [Cu-Zn] n=1 Tax=Lutibaculum baratangense AMV1 TaxID=631454 RepID=V4RJ01_9HYPH|nr:superoxide dismutase family protein [Lutibaculum baratangense]ESR25299.1 Superoxide dismutase [Cu-Zn] precursor [Lutibaculum baratangense AMV1]